MSGDANYFKRRAIEERAAALKAAHPDARRAHLEMAARYDDLASAIAAHPLSMPDDLFDQTSPRQAS